MKGIDFVKMNASGNDFIIIDNRKGTLDERFPDLNNFVKKVCRRKFSVGADGLILVENSENAHFKWRFFNSDGSEAEMCGNGGRCVARYAYEKAIAPKKMTFETKAGIIKAEANGKRVKIQLGNPHSLKLDYEIKVGQKQIIINSVNTGVPHVVILFDNIKDAPVEELGKRIRFHDVFLPQGTNVNFVKILSKNEIAVRTYERGVEGETYACGTGAVASAFVLKEKGLVQTPLNVLTKGGETLKVYIEDGVFLEGDVHFVYEGRLHPEALI